MLSSLKPISYGIITIIVLGLVNQLVLIVSLVGYGSLTKTYPALSEWNQFFTYSLGTLGYFIVMFFGGLITSISSIKHHYLNAFIASIVGSNVSLYLSLKDEIFTPIAFIFMIIGIIASMLACWLWHFYQKKKSLADIQIT